ncbi:hypothetical protein VNO80_33049 [Phaseolus coccineus]|uniref:Uncharacterized protein n=1 Tax=Phaseolus coccineus TaxID=3886 RepID=A0AAN9KZM1_PHACN
MLGEEIRRQLKELLESLTNEKSPFFELSWLEQRTENPCVSGSNPLLSGLWVQRTGSRERAGFFLIQVKEEAKKNVSAPALYGFLASPYLAGGRFYKKSGLLLGLVLASLCPKGWASSVRVFIDRVDLYAEGGETRCSAVCLKSTRSKLSFRKRKKETALYLIWAGSKAAFLPNVSGASLRFNSFLPIDLGKDLRWESNRVKLDTNLRSSVHNNSTGSPLYYDWYVQYCITVMRLLIGWQFPSPPPSAMKEALHFPVMRIAGTGSSGKASVINWGMKAILPVEKNYPMLTVEN